MYNRHMFKDYEDFSQFILYNLTNGETNSIGGTNYSTSREYSSILAKILIVWYERKTYPIINLFSEEYTAKRNIYEKYNYKDNSIELDNIGIKIYPYNDDIKSEKSQSEHLINLEIFKTDTYGFTTDERTLNYLSTPRKLVDLEFILMDGIIYTTKDLRSIKDKKKSNLYWRDEFEDMSFIKKELADYISSLSDKTYEQLYEVLTELLKGK